MKRQSLWTRAFALVLALLMLVTIFFSGCDAEKVDLALDIADAVLESALAESETQTEPKQELTTPESSQAPPVNVAPPEKITETQTPTEIPAETPVETPAEIPEETPSEEPSAEETPLDEQGRYTSPKNVALYIHTYGKLPCNFITKNEAKKLGWNSNEGNLWEVTDRMSIGGDRFGNYEGLLPDAEGRTWKECDVNYQGGYRGAERILFSNDGLIYYTDDHYKSFTQLY